MAIIMKLTKHIIDGQMPGPSDIFLWDTSPQGFGVRVRPSGTKSFIYSYRAGGGRLSRELRYTIGRIGSLTLEQARREAQKLAGRAAGGQDPAAERDAQRLETARKKNTVAVVADEFIERYAKPKNRSWREYQRILDRNVKPRIGSRPIDEITRREIVVLLDHTADHSGATMSRETLKGLPRGLGRKTDPLRHKDVFSSSRPLRHAETDWR